MKDNLIDAFDKIHAEDHLKAKTASFLIEKIENSNKTASPFFSKRLIAGFAMLLVVVFSSIHVLNLYSSPITYIDMDINPSIELSVNTFGRIISAQAYNKDGEAVLTGVKIKNRKYEDAMPILLDYMSEKNYLKDDSLVSITVQSYNKNSEETLIKELNKVVPLIIETEDKRPQIEIFPVDMAVKNSSHSNNVTPAKYMAVEELIAVDPNESFSSCSNRSVREIREITDTHHKQGRCGNREDIIDDKVNDLPESGRGCRH